MLVRICLAAIFILSLIGGPAHANFASFQASSTFTLFQTLKIGGGGFLHGLDIECDQGRGNCNNTGTTTKVARTDTYGAYWFNPTTPNCGNANATGCWQQLITASNFPDSLFASCYTDCGAYEIRIAPSNTQKFYMYASNGYVYTQASRASNWVRTNFANVAVNPNIGATASMGPYIAIDPQNELVAIVGTPASGAFYTIDGSNFTQISGLCTPTSVAGQGGGYLIAFDPSSAVVSGKTQGVYISCYGTGVYHSTTGVSGTFTLTSGTPTTHQHMVIDSAGTLYLIDNGGDYNVNYFTGGVWASKSVGSGGQGPLVSIAIDPSSNNKLTALAAGGNISYTSSGVTTGWSGISSTPTRNASTDIPWLSNTLANFLSAGDIAYDSAQSNVLYFSEGIGIMFTNPSGSGSVVYTDQSAAIEQLVTTWIISPPSGTPLALFFDRPAFQITSPTQVYPSHHSINDNAADAIIEGYSADWCSSTPSTIAMVAVGSSDFSGLSTTGGVYNSWTTFATQPPNSLTYTGGSIACSTPTNMVRLLGEDGINAYTVNGGTTWPPITVLNVQDVLTTNGSTATSSKVLHFAATVPAWIVAGSQAYDITTPLAMGTNNSVVSTTSTSVTLTNNVSATVNSGDVIVFNAGGFFASFNFKRQNIVADRVTANTFYAYNSGSAHPGIYKSSNSGQNFALTAQTGHFDAGDGGYVQMRSVPGVAGNFYYTSGINGPPMNGYLFYECNDSGTVSCAAVSGVSNVISFGFGKAKPGGSGYPTIIIYGQISGVFGFWYSTDHGVTWIQAGSQFAWGTQDQVSVIEGDSNTYGLFYIGLIGSGLAYGRFN